MPIETKPAPKAVRILTEQYHAARMKHANELAAVALETVGLHPQDGWKYNVDTGEFQRHLPDQTPPEETPDAS